METTINTEIVTSVKKYGQTFNERDIVKIYTILHLVNKADLNDIGSLNASFNEVFSKVIPIETLDTFLIKGTDFVKEINKVLKRDKTLEKQRNKHTADVQAQEQRKKDLGLL